ncbi:hypothetical protein HDU97_005150 [Phlyctochytrium planicorne]|nr:hypothetical protein HDU97_005150 [Phlyctochytrium planicorne]
MQRSGYVDSGVGAGGSPVPPHPYFAHGPEPPFPPVFRYPDSRDLFDSSQPLPPTSQMYPPPPFMYRNPYLPGSWYPPPSRMMARPQSPGFGQHEGFSARSQVGSSDDSLDYGLEEEEVTPKASTSQKAERKRKKEHDTAAATPVPAPKKHRKSAEARSHLTPVTTSTILPSSASALASTTTDNSPMALAAEQSPQILDQPAFPSSAPVPAPPNPAPSRSRTKKMVEADIRCSKPNCQTPHGTEMGMCILHGATKLPSEIIAACVSCIKEESDETLASSEDPSGRRAGAGPSRRASEAGQMSPLASPNSPPSSAASATLRFGQAELHHCSLCKNAVGRLAFMDVNVEAQAALDFQVEAVCFACRRKYSFCTECGGGGRFRTGKWRPQELFSFGRKTCSLSHIRIGAAPLEFGVFALPAELGAATTTGTDADLNGFLEECRQVFEDCLYATAAVPEMMERTHTSFTFEDVRTRVSKEFSIFASSVRGEGPPQLWSDTSSISDVPATSGSTSTSTASAPRTQRYLAISCIPQTKKKRGRIVADEGTSTKPTKPGRPGQSKETATAPKRTLVACALAEYDIDTNLLYILNLTVRVPTLQQGAIDGEVICAILDRVEADFSGSFAPVDDEDGPFDATVRHSPRRPRSNLSASTSSTRPTRTHPDDTSKRSPAHVSILVRTSYPKWKAQLARLGFVERKSFASRHPTQVFDDRVVLHFRETFQESFDELFSTFGEIRTLTHSKVKKKAVTAARSRKGAGAEKKTEEDG